MSFRTATTRRLTTGKALTALPAAVLATTALALTACSPSASAGSTATAAPSAAGTSGPASSGAGSPSAAPSSTPPISSAGAGQHACTTGQLSVQQKDPGVGAGQYYSELVFTNTSTTGCTMSGYPGVSYVAQAGVQSGNAADRAPGTVATVTLKPGGTASAQLHDSNGVSGYDPAQCQLSPAQGLRIYPPGQTTALFLPWQTQHCAGPTIHSLTIGPLS